MLGWRCGARGLTTFWRRGRGGHRRQRGHGGAAARAQRRVQSAALENNGTMTVLNALEAAFRTFDACRRERTQWLVQNSRVCGDIFQWRFPPNGKDAEQCKKELE